MAYWQRTFQRKLCSVLIALLISSCGLLAQLPKTPRQRAENNFLAACAQVQNEKTNIDAAWKFARACFDWAEFAENNEQRAAIAQQGIEASRRVILHRPKSVEGHYYLAMNLGQLARTKTLGALRLVDEMEQQFKIAVGSNQGFDFAGPDRNLGLLYYEAPGWPASIGSRSKARQHLERAAKFNPKYPENCLNLIEAYLKWGDKTGAQREFKLLKEVWLSAKKEFSGDQWDSSWADWEKRCGNIQVKLSEPPQMLEAPCQKK